jgi:unsaturated rhamnogalacturonyl hydrolase
MTTRKHRAAAFILPLAVAILAAPPLNAPPKEFSKWPARSSPKEIGKRLAERFVATLHTNFGRSAPPSFITCPESVAWYGALTFAQLSGDKDLSSRLVQRFEPLFGAESKLVPKPTHVDLTAFSVVPRKPLSFPKPWLATTMKRIHSGHPS